MRTNLFSLLALGVAAAMAGPADRAQAGEPMVLTDAQLDLVVAGTHRGGVNEITLKRGVTESAPTWIPDTGEEVIVSFEPAGPRQIIHLTVGTPGTQRSSHDRYANIEVNYLLQR